MKPCTATPRCRLHGVRDTRRGSHRTRAKYWLGKPTDFSIYSRQNKHSTKPQTHQSNTKKVHNNNNNNNNNNTKDIIFLRCCGRRFVVSLYDELNKHLGSVLPVSSKSQHDQNGQHAKQHRVPEVRRQPVRQGARSRHQLYLEARKKSSSSAAHRAGGGAEDTRREEHERRRRRRRVLR